MLFKWGSGTGTNLSSIRGSHGDCSRAAARPPARLSFMRGFDAFAGVIKSGGKTRRAAKMVILNVDHPDIMDFIECKAKEEAKAFALIKAGYDGSGPDSEAYSLDLLPERQQLRPRERRVHARLRDATATSRPTRSRSHEPVKTYKARDIMRKIAEATWLCGDPGLQFDTTINRWHTSKNTARINASNPCSEYMFLDNSACNLASFNLMKFVTPAGSFDIAAYRHAISVVITAMEILVDNSGYPTGVDRPQLARLSPAGPGLRQSGRAADGHRSAVRLNRRTRHGWGISPPSCAVRLTCSRPSSPLNARRSRRPLR